MGGYSKLQGQNSWKHTTTWLSSLTCLVQPPVRNSLPEYFRHSSPTQGAFTLYITFSLVRY